MAKKLKWEQEKKCGNILAAYIAFATYKGKPISLDKILVFSKGTFTMPPAMFPRDKNMKCKKVKSLAKAKKMVQEWFDIFIKENQ